MAAAPLREFLRDGGVAIVWCGMGLSHERAAQAARVEGARWLAAVGLDGLHVSRSACDGLAAVALCGHQPVGVDVEPTQALSLDKSTAWVRAGEVSGPLDSDSHLPIAIWVRKEAVLKCLGVGLALPPARFQTGGDLPGWTRVDTGPHGHAHVLSVNPPCTGFMAAVATQAHAPAAVMSCESHALNAAITGGIPCFRG